MPEKNLELIERYYSGESHQKLADDYKLTQPRVSQLIMAYEKQQKKAAGGSARWAGDATRRTARCLKRYGYQVKGVHYGNPPQVYALGSPACHSWWGDAGM